MDGLTREQIARFFDAVTDVIFVLRVEDADSDRPAFRFEAINRVFELATGLARAEVIGKTIEQVLPPTSHELVRGHYVEAIRRREAVDWEEIAVYPAGKRVGHVTARPIFDASGACTHLLGTVHDITRLRATEEMLAQAQKLEAVGRLAGGIAHDFNNLLCVILAHGGMLMNDLRPGDPMRAGLAEIHAAAERAATLTRQLLAYSRQQVLQPRNLDVNKLVANMDGLLRRLVGEDVEVVAKLAATHATIVADPSQMEQVLMNLAVNARDAMPAGGRLAIETSSVDLGEDYVAHHPDVTPGPHVMIAVSDTGTGMDRATQARAFDPFFTTKEAGKGTGLGLATVLGIVKQSGGHIWLYSEVGKGTTFKVYFPFRPAVTAIAEASAPADEPASRRGSETILVVEDDAQVRMAMRGILKKCGYQVFDAQNGAEALLLCERFSGAIHLLVTDVVMPQMSGREIADRLHETRPSMKVLYVSGYTDNTIVHHGILEEGIQFLEKPVTLSSLSRKVRSVLSA